tara:strand:+ start:2542 stop:3693 length:1152 start_codon:yes stop_codon:yes gene_type:complete
MQEVIKTHSFLDSLNEIIKKNDYSKIFFFTGSIGRKILKASNYGKNSNCFIYSDFKNDPSLDDVYKAVKILSNFESDLVIGIGGGSTIDIAKQVNCLSSNYDIDKISKDMLAKYIIDKDLLFKKKPPPMIAIPTTAGTGSEATQFSVIYINKVKHSIDNQCLLPNQIILDPQLLVDIEPELVATTVMDALSQSIESLWSIKSNDESTEYATNALLIIKKNIKKIAKGYPNIDTIQELMDAAHLAGKAINITRTTAPHALSYPLSMHLKIPHGHAVALTLPNFFIINSSIEKYQINDLRGKGYVKERMEYIFELFLEKGATAKQCRNEFHNIMEILNLETDLNKLRIKEVGSRIILNDINQDRLVNNPVSISDEDINKILTITS